MDDTITGVNLRPDTALVREMWRALHREGEVREVRIPKARTGGPNRLFGTVSGYFNDEDCFVRAVGRLCGQDAESVYVTLNPVTPDLLARAVNRLVSSARTTTSDADVIRRAHLLIDVDPRRPAGLSATDSERMGAVQARDKIEAFLRDLWGISPVYSAMSGNGGGLVYRIDLPNDADSLALVSAVLKALAGQFDDEAVSIDQTVANAARITKVIGTVSAKGDDAPSVGRRWRVATAKFHADAEVVSSEQLRMLAALAQPVLTSPTRDAEVDEGDTIWGRVNNHGSRSWEVEDLLESQGIDAHAVAKPYGTVYELDRCLTSTDHEDGAAIVELKSGALAYRCHHNSCAGRTWSDARVALGLPSRDAMPEPAIAVATRSADQSHHQRLSRVAQADGRLRRPILTCVADVTPESVKWLFPGRIPLGKLTIVEGDPGLGKSTLLVDIAARLTIDGVMPDGTHGDVIGPANVVILSAEDGAGDTIRPRLEAAGADLRRAFILEAVEEHRA